MPLVFEDAGTGASGGAVTTLDIPYPATVDADDLLIIGVGLFDVDGSSPTIDTPSGWTEILSGGAPFSSQSRHAVFYKKATGAESGNETITVTGTPTYDMLGQMFRFSGQDLTDPIYASARNSGSGGAEDIGVTTTADGDMAVNVLYEEDQFSTAEGLSAFTGMTGGTWVEQAEAGPSAEDLGQNLQTDVLETAGTINGGSGAGVDDHWACVGFAIRAGLDEPATPPARFPPLGMRGGF
jgi:hypothetical protein